MDMQQLDQAEYLCQQLTPFVEECERRGYPVKNLRVRETFPGDHKTFCAEVDTDWADDSLKARHLLRPILKETTPEEIHNYIRSLDVGLAPAVKQKNREDALARLQARLDFAVKTKNNPQYWGVDPSTYILPDNVDVR
jgi:hypothetical protein